MIADTAPAGAEAARQTVLGRYRVLDSANEPAFDRIVHLATMLLEVPIALISLIDNDRQWFKARRGMDACETPRSMAFCDHAVRGSDVFIVPDAQQDPRFRDNPLVTGAPHLRFYAGAPLKTPEGVAVGTLCVMDREPRRLRPRDAAVLTSLAEQVVHELEVRAALGDLYQEVAEGRRASRGLKGDGARLEALLNATGNAVVTTDGQGNVASLNNIAEKLFALDPGEALGWPIKRLISTENSGGSDGTSRSNDGIGRRKDGTEFPIELSRASWMDAQGCLASGAILRDVTERRRAEVEKHRRDTLARTQEKLAALGGVAGGVAHEMNNLLQPVIGLSELELESIPADGTPAQQETRENLATVIECGRQMRAIVRKILMFARKDSPALTATDFPDALRRAVAFVGNLLPPGVEVDDAIYNIRSGSAVINEVELIEVMTNLAVNAADAMNGRGTLSIRLQRRTLDDGAAAALGLAPGKYFEVLVADTGEGMDAATKAHIFDPFFTTKPIGKGTGLGLSAAYGVLRGWKGAIAVDSTVGQGTTFSLYIPASDRP